MSCYTGRGVIRSPTLPTIVAISLSWQRLTCRSTYVSEEHTLGCPCPHMGLRRIKSLVHLTLLSHVNVHSVHLHATPCLYIGPLLSSNDLLTVSFSIHFHFLELSYRSTVMGKRSTALQAGEQRVFVRKACRMITPSFVALLGISNRDLWPLLRKELHYMPKVQKQLEQQTSQQYAVRRRGCCLLSRHRRSHC